ncbi:hypothetical protein RFI_12725 [Reticulomyxa filosa]|uniref:Transmembrane protein n=1 Tax=Reticulomyxa filosa TaxID=46433 RepID=X6NGG4_RETFI|nr:hypothetical protein RFI_12725 [Reticulomyxa filosa]|eukprot:ETO24432.1 hypothetical protein RFI_12725 [Reticulomyxa filosa]
MQPTVFPDQINNFYEIYQTLHLSQISLYIFIVVVIVIVIIVDNGLDYTANNNNNNNNVYIIIVIIPVFNVCFLTHCLQTILFQNKHKFLLVEFDC